MIVSREDPAACPKCGGANLEQDPDVLDTWFSSGLWPFSTLGWPDETPDYKYFYPTSVLETGYDILFFWVARMIMDGIEFTGQPPFHTVYLHGLIRDEHGQKMSKTKGNVIDPLVVMNEMGTDALRFTLLVGSTPGNDMNLSIKKVEANRNFANKMWNAGRFVIGALENAPSQPSDEGQEPEWTLADSWIWARLQGLIRDVERLFENCQYGEAGRQIYDFFWSEFADWYVEISKHQMAHGGDRVYFTAATLVRVLDACLRLLHPFTPFVTEELWGHLKRAAQEKGPAYQTIFGDSNWEEALITARFPEPREVEAWETQKVEDFNLVQEIVRAVRNLRTEKRVPPSRKVPAILAAGDNSVLDAQRDVIAYLAQLDPQSLTITPAVDEKPQNAAAQTILGIEIYLPLEGLVDMEAEKARLQKELQENENQIKRLESLLGGSFAERAPAQVVERERQKLATFKETAARLREQLSATAGRN